MKAARFHPEDLSIRLEESPIPEIDEDEILVKTIAAGLCHSDLVGHSFKLSVSKSYQSIDARGRLCSSDS